MNHYSKPNTVDWYRMNYILWGFLKQDVILLKKFKRTKPEQFEGDELHPVKGNKITCHLAGMKKHQRRANRVGISQSDNL